MWNKERQKKQPLENDGNHTIGKVIEIVRLQRLISLNANLVSSDKKTARRRGKLDKPNLNYADCILRSEFETFFTCTTLFLCDFTHIDYIYLAVSLGCDKKFQLWKNSYLKYDFMGASLTNYWLLFLFLKIFLRLSLHSNILDSSKTDVLHSSHSRGKKSRLNFFSVSMKVWFGKLVLFWYQPLSSQNWNNYSMV